MLTELRCHASLGETWVLCIMGRQPEILHDTSSSAGTSLRSAIKWLFLMFVIILTIRYFRIFNHCLFSCILICLLRSLRTSTRMTSTRTYCRNPTALQISCHSPSLVPQKPLYRYMCSCYLLVFSSFPLICFIFCCHLFIYIFVYFPLFSSQVLRSVDRWSAGTCEHSILNAYIHVIENSEHYIYLEVTLTLWPYQKHLPLTHKTLRTQLNRHCPLFTHKVSVLWSCLQCSLPLGSCDSTAFSWQHTIASALASCSETGS